MVVSDPHVKANREDADHSLPETSHEGFQKHCYFEILTEDLLLWVLTFVPPSDLLRNGCLVCTRFYGALRQEQFWRSLESSKILLKQQHMPMPLTRHQFQRYGLFRDAVTAKQYGILATVLEEGSVLETTGEAIRLKRNGRLVCAASTTDRPSEELENVLPSRVAQGGYNFLGRNHFLRKWWSSRPTPEPDTRSEVLLFTTRAPVCVITQIHVKPLLDPYVGHTIYSW